MSSKSDFSEIATKRYALALFELGQENSELNKIKIPYGIKLTVDVDPISFN